MEFDSLTKSDLISSRKSQDEEAKTLAGKVIGSFSDLFSPGQVLDADQRKAKAKRDDDLATVAADTVAMLPGLRLPAAGLIRATALARVDDGAVSLSLNFAKDFVEGAALNKIASLTVPEGKLGKAISAKLGKGFLADTASFALTGAAIAGTSTGFKTETWLDENKSFSISHGVGETLKAGTIGGVMGAPAGLLGKKIANVGIGLAQEGRISSSTALVFSGVGGGYLSGAAIGGAQGYFATGNLKGAWYGASEGGLTGALSGGVGVLGIHAFNSKFGKMTEVSIDREPAFSMKAELAINSLERTAQEGSAGSSRALELEKWRRLEIGADKLHDSETTLADRVGKLGTPLQGTAYYYQALPQAAEAAAASRSYSEFISRGGAHLVHDNVRLYNVNRTLITIPESYAAQLDEVLALRLRAAEEPDFYGKGYGQVKEVTDARSKLEVHPLRDRAHPADFVHLLEELPDRGLVKEILIRHDNAPGNAWKTKEFGYDFKSAATVDEDGRMSFYAQNRSPLLREYFKHEWSHLLKWAARVDSNRFDEAAKLEKDGYYVSEYSKTNNDENWAEHAATILHPDPDKFLATVQDAPLRSFEIVRALLRSFNARDRAFTGIHQEELSRRQAYVAQEVMPVVRETLLDHVKSGHPENAKIAGKLLAPIAGEAELRALHDLAKTSNNVHVREAAFSAALTQLKEPRVAVDGYTQRTYGASKAQMRDFLVDQAQPGNRSRPAALERLSNLGDEQSKFQYDLLTLDTYKGSKLSRVLKLMDDAPNSTGLRAAWDQGMKLAASNRDLRVDLALRALGRHPQLISEVVNTLATEGQERTRPFLMDLTEHYNARVVQRAKEGLEKLDLEVRINDMKARLKSDVEEQRIMAAGDLAATRRAGVVPAIVDAMVSAKSNTELSGIKNAVEPYISQGILRFELRQRQTSPGADVSKIQGILKNGRI